MLGQCYSWKVINPILPTPATARDTPGDLPGVAHSRTGALLTKLVVMLVGTRFLLARGLSRQTIREGSGSNPLGQATHPP